DGGGGTGGGEEARRPPFDRPRATAGGGVGEQESRPSRIVLAVLSWLGVRLDGQRRAGLPGWQDRRGALPGARWRGLQLIAHCQRWPRLLERQRWQDLCGQGWKRGQVIGDKSAWWTHLGFAFDYGKLADLPDGFTSVLHW